MSGDRRKFIRQDEHQRRDALIKAAVDLISEVGPQGATVRAIAEQAGVTAGLIRHYFTSKEVLTRAAYSHVMETMIEDSLAPLAHAPEQPEARLAVFVAASLRPPVMDPRAMGIWAGFLQLMKHDPEMQSVHEVSYLRYRDLLQGLIAALPRTASAQQLRRDAIACNGVIDGLWLEGCALPAGFAPGELEQIGLQSVGAILGVDLLSALPEMKKDNQ
ncbi:MAG: TetR family transcriptional regulator C-terminal domain-containing protein [Pseudorhodobacter sp.]|nr:TetR family transcriptional regulator C-terminal domain-containing protein [Pseudorhodobacter sp.]MDN5786068.1 TetR family transcriptional regulator C-terminal domain-containing protein [Pseudorhodobacter sp.]